MVDPAGCVRSRRTSGAAVVAPLGAIVLGALVGAALLLLAAAGEQNRLQLLHERRLADFGLHAVEDVLRKSVKDYVNWDEAFIAFGEPFDDDWAFTNLGGAYTNLGFDYGIVLDLDGKSRMVLDRGERVDVEAAAVLGKGLDKVLRAARDLVSAGAEVASGILVDRQGPVLVAAGVVVPQTAELSAEHGPPRRFLLMGKRLDGEVIGELRERLGLASLRLVAVDEPPAEGEGSIGLVAADGSLAGLLRWRTAAPGEGTARLVAPVLSIVGIVSSALVAITLRNMRRPAAELVESEQRFRDVALASSDWIFETGPEGRLVFLSERFEEVTGLPARNAIGSHLDALLERITVEDGPGEGIAAVLARAEPFRDVVCRLRAPTSSPRLLRLAARPVFDASGGLVGWRGTATDLTSESEALARARYLALHDALTGLANRTRFRALLEEQLALADRSGHRLAVLVLDLDRFKEVNAGLGHAIGDGLLRLAARRLSGEFRPKGGLARVGGDEFAAIVAGTADPGEIVALGRRLVDVSSRPFEIDGQWVVSGASVGIALAPEHGRSATELLRNANLALDRARARGRGQVQLFEPGMAEALRERQRLEVDLRGALERGELLLHYQPKFEVMSGRLVACEALLRWQHPTRGLLPPAAFVGLAEETGLIAAIGGWVVEEACRKAAEWGGLAVAVNLSAAQLRDDRLVDRVRAALARSGLPPDRLELEITETVLIGDPPRAGVVLAALEALGVRIAMDDFGTGFSSLYYLQRFRFDTIKIDRSFVERLTERPRDAATVAAIIRLGRALGMRTCAEGVETPRQLEALRAAGCDDVQGYLLGRPVSAGELERVLAEAPRAVTGGERHRAETSAAEAARGRARTADRAAALG